MLRAAAQGRADAAALLLPWRDVGGCLLHTLVVSELQGWLRKGCAVRVPHPRPAVWDRGTPGRLPPKRCAAGTVSTAADALRRGLQKIDKEVADAIAALEKEKEAALASLDTQVRDPATPAALLASVHRTVHLLWLHGSWVQRRARCAPALSALYVPCRWTSWPARSCSACCQRASRSEPAWERGGGALSVCCRAI